MAFSFDLFRRKFGMHLSLCHAFSISRPSCHFSHGFSDNIMGEVKVIFSFLSIKYPRIFHPIIRKNGLFFVG
jgi:hypothetical protein